MWVSLNEIESTALKASRGAGYHWGLAEEAGQAARWLAMRGLPWLKPLTAGVLRQMFRLESFDSAQQVGTSYGPTDSARRMGPISVLTALSDETLTLPQGSGELSLRHLAAPVLVLPALARLSKRYDRPLLVRWPGLAIECHAGEIVAGAGSLNGLDVTRVDWLIITKSVMSAPAVTSLRHQGAEVDTMTWSELTDFANRTYVPEGETSRLRGAGAGLTDND